MNSLPDLQIEAQAALLDQLSIVAFVKDLSGRYIAANAAARQLLDPSHSGLLGKTDFDLLPSEQAQVLLDEELAIRKSGLPLDVSLEIASENEALRTARLRKTRWTNAQDETIGILAIEIASEARADDRALLEQNAKLERKRAQLRALVDHIPDLIYFKDTQSRFVNANKRQLDQLGVETVDDIAGKTDFDFYDAELAQNYFDDEQEILRTGVEMHKEEPSDGPDGRRIYLSTTKVPIREAATGKTIGIAGIGRDITDITLAREKLTRKTAELSEALDKLKHAQSKLVQSEKLASLGVLTAGIAHEINNPINFVYAGVNSIVKDLDDVKQVVAKMRELPDREDPGAAVRELAELQRSVGFDDAFEALEETLKDIKHGATRITDIVSGLSKFSRLSQETWQESDLHDDLESVLLLLKNKYNSGIRIERDFAPDLPRIECHPGKLNQAFMNVLSNAIDAIYEKKNDGGILIRTWFDENEVSVMIQDDGVGMDEEVRAKVFDPFFTTKQIGKGVGLGMAITHSIIQDHRGRLSLETRLGKGSRFEIALPRRQTQNQAR